MENIRDLAYEGWMSKRQGKEKVLAKTRGEQAAEKPGPKKTGVGARNR